MNTKPMAIANQILEEPRPVKHRVNLLWWMFLVSLVISIQHAPDFINTQSQAPEASDQSARIENEAFVAMVFGKISAASDLAISPATFESQMAALKRSGYTTIRLPEVIDWRREKGVSLPDKPVVITFEEAHRETLEAADKVLASLGMTGVVFVNPNLMDRGNIQWVSWHQLKRLVDSGRWEVGLSGCQDEAGGEALAHAEALAQQYSDRRETIERRIGRPVVAVDCPRFWRPGQNGAAETWNQALRAAQFSIGFVTAPLGANYRDDAWSGLRRIRVSKHWDGSKLLAQIASHAPRRKPFIDDFQAPEPAADWVVDRGQVVIENGLLKVSNEAGEQGALVVLGGTERWRNASVEVRVDGPPKGQFWISLRSKKEAPLIRLGVSEGRVLLQEGGANGAINQLASAAAPAGGFTLALRVQESRLLAYVDGQPLLDRPALAPAGTDQGSLTLAVWNDSAASPEPGAAEARLQRVKAEPLTPKYGIVAANPAPEAWANLRGAADELSIISPRYFAWESGGHRQTAGRRDAALEIYAHHHRLKFLPAVVVDERTPPSDLSALAEQALNWAGQPGYDGLNIVLKSSSAEPPAWRTFLAALDARLAERGKQLAVTRLDALGQDALSLDSQRVDLVRMEGDDGGTAIGGQVVASSW